MFSVLIRKMSRVFLSVVIFQLSFAILARCDDAEALLVQTLQGPVRGYKDSVEDIFAFYGIPYATAPTGRNRFKAPLPASTWLNPFEAVDDSIICPQHINQGVESFYIGKRMRENCLIANIFKPNTYDTELPVVVYVHGGGYQMGFGNFYSPKKLVVAQNIIVVTFNYRLSIHGFLCLGTNDIPGNAGMKDQLALLRWVKNNIASFGGNPVDVTIAGYSAGGSSVDHIMLSPAAKGLFTKVIAESGGIFVGSGLQLDPTENAKEFARNYISNVDDISVLEEFYKSATFEVLTTESFFDRKDSSFLFTPCMEKNTEEESFLEDNPYNIVVSGNYDKVPLLYGFTTMEGLLRIEFFELWKDSMNSDFSDFLPPDLQFESVEERNAIAMDVKKAYFGEQDVSKKTILSYVDFFSDVIFIYPLMRALKLYVNSGHDKIYLYEYSFVDDDTPVVPHTNVRGADHCAQTLAIFDGAPFQNITEEEISDEYWVMKMTMRSLWASFIRTGNPTPAGSQWLQWPPTGANGSQHMSLNNILQLRGAPLQDRMRLWEKNYDQHYRLPIPPQTSSATMFKQTRWYILAGVVVLLFQ